MGNAESAVAGAAAKASFGNSMKDISQQLGLDNKPKTEKELVGVKNKKEAKERRAAHEEEYKEKQAARAERKKALSEKWAKSRQGG